MATTLAPRRTVHHPKEAAEVVHRMHLRLPGTIRVVPGTIMALDMAATRDASNVEIAVRFCAARVELELLFGGSFPFCPDLVQSLIVVLEQG